MDTMSGLKKIICIIAKTELGKLKEAIPEDFSLYLNSRLNWALVLPALRTWVCFLREHLSP